jgi:hypothetical protein
VAVGNNGETLVADSSTTTGLRYQSAKAVNHVINGGQDFWQRGTSFTAGNGVYTADRFMALFGVGVGTASRQTTSDTTNLPEIQYCARVQRNSGVTATGLIYYFSTLESAESTQLQGKTVVLSFWARRGANFSGGSNTLSAEIRQGTGIDQNMLTGLTGETTVVGQNVTMTTSWQRFQITGTVASTTTQLGFRFYYAPTGTAGAADYFEVTGVQLELGSVATTFQRSGGTLQGELSACQRYFIRYAGTPAGGAVKNPLCTAYLQSTVSAQGVINFPVSMRTDPTMSVSAAADIEISWSAGTSATSAVALDLYSPTSAFIRLTTTGLTTGQGAYLGVAAGNTKFIQFSAEL